MSEQKNFVPKLRFPEFKNTEAWKEIRLIDSADKKTKWSFIGGPFGSNLKSSDYVQNGIRVIQLQNIGDGQFLDKYKIFTSINKANELLSNNIFPGEIILSKMGDPVGRACLIPKTHERYVMCSDGIRLVVDELSYSKYFIYTLINSNQFRDLVDKTATGSTRKRIGLDDLKNLPMVVPKKKDEQQKIADCLSSLDGLIAAQNQKVQILKQHKKSLMQQLFPAEGETVPKLRFPEFENDGEWQEKTIGQVAIYENGKAHEQDISEYGRYVVVNSKFISTDGKIKKYTNEGNCLAKRNDILMVLSDVPNGRAIAKCFVVDENDRYTVNQRISKLTPTQVNSKFLFYLVNRNEYFLSFDDGVKQTNLKNDDVLNCPLLLPGNPIEQEKIAICLSLLEETIDTQTQKTESLKNHKKGLMQQLFPSINEVDK